MNQRKKKGFDFLAPIYDWGTTLFFGGKVFAEQVYYLDRLPDKGKMLMLGGGSGKLLARIFEKGFEGEVTYVDFSPKMIAKTEERILREFPLLASRVHYICGSVEDIPEGLGFDCILTPFVLDCIRENELDGIILKLMAHLAPDGKWLFVDFNLPDRGAKRFFFGIWLKLILFFFNLVCGLGLKRYPDFGLLFKKAGLKLVEEHYSLGSFLTSRLYSHQ